MGESRKKYTSSDTVANRIMAERLKELRKDNGYTQKELAEELNKYIDVPDVYQTSNISSWELGHRPRIQALHHIAGFYRCSIEYLLGKTDDRYLQTGNSEKKQPSTDMLRPIRKRDLCYFDGEPVWIESDEMTQKGCWGLVNCVDKTITLSDGTSILISQIPFKLYMRPLPFTLSMTAVRSTPLILEKAKEIGERGQVWIELISKYREAKNAYRGWYRYCEESQSFSKICSGLVLPASGYDIAFVAFEDPISIIGDDEYNTELE